ncbi:MAG TPA: hypothetical protein VI136_12320 [Verrucomicrobiae bacterium]
MSTITVSDLKRKPAGEWLPSAGEDDVVVTAEGQPVAVLLRTDAESLAPTLAALRSVRALRAQAALQKAAVSNGTDQLGLADIDAEIAAARHARRRR